MHLQDRRHRTTAKAFLRLAELLVGVSIFLLEYDWTAFRWSKTRASPLLFRLSPLGQSVVKNILSYSPLRENNASDNSVTDKIFVIPRLFIVYNLR
jgi:hypothetical protein